MNAKDTNRLRTIREQANQLMDAKPSLTPVVTTAQVVEAMIGDIDNVLASRDPRWLAELIERDKAS